MLNSLRPVLSRFPKRERQELVDLAIYSGFSQWALDNLPEIVSDKDYLHLWQTDGQIIEILDAAAALVPQGVQAVQKGSHLAQLENSRAGRELVRVLSVVSKWLGTAPDANQLAVAATLAAALGTGDDLEWWRSLEPKTTAERILWKRALFILERRKWHDMESGSDE